MYRKFLSLIMMLLCLCGKVMAQGTADLVIADATDTYQHAPNQKQATDDSHQLHLIL